MSYPELGTEDRQSATWRRISDALSIRLEELRVENDANHEPAATAKLRGRIAEVKLLLAMGDDPDPVAMHAGSDELPAD